MTGIWKWAKKAQATYKGESVLVLKSANLINMNFIQSRLPQKLHASN